MASDGRIAAWMAAWDLTQSAAQLRAESTDGDYPPVYWAALKEAQIYARLATVDDLIGFSTGEILTDRQEAQQEAQRQSERMRERLQNGADVDLDVDQSAV